VEAVRAVESARRRVTLWVALSVVEVLITTVVRAAGPAAVGAVPVAGRVKAGVVAVGVVDPGGLAFDAAAAAAARQAVAPVVLAARGVAGCVALAVAQLLPGAVVRTEHL